mgnify:CR=1 FL=1
MKELITCGCQLCGGLCPSIGTYRHDVELTLCGYCNQFHVNHPPSRMFPNICLDGRKHGQWGASICGWDHCGRGDHFVQCGTGRVATKEEFWEKELYLE